MPRPPPERINVVRADLRASRPATSDIGASSGSEPIGSSTVS
jgi:hypothetical protein